MILVKPEHDLEWKNERFFDVIFFALYSETNVFPEIRILVCVFLFTCGDLTWFCTVFFIFLI